MKDKDRILGIVLICSLLLNDGLSLANGKHSIFGILSGVVANDLGCSYTTHFPLAKSQRCAIAARRTRVLHR